MALGIGFGGNYDVKAHNGLGPRTVIIKLAKSNMTQAELDEAAQAIMIGGTFSGVTNDAFTIAGVSSDGGDAGADNSFVSGESDAVFMALQGTGTINADSSNALGVTGVALTVEATFDGSRD
tara:strand:- start:246 stop:611 length:366 start_codon:yes stop_codon:yes gene_type:complete